MKRIQVQVKHNNKGEYLIVKYGNLIYHSDDEVAWLMGISMERYQKLLLDEFNNVIFTYLNELYFYNLDSAIIAAEWLQKNIMPYILLKELNPNIVIE